MSEQIEKKRTLFDIHEDILAVERLVEYNDGEMSDEIEIKMTELQLEEREKILSVCAWFKRLDMELEGIQLHKKEVDARFKTLKNLKERLRRWIFKGAKLAGIIRGNERDGWEGDKVENAQIKLSWRRSEGAETDESAQGFDELPKHFPHFFDFKVRPTEDGGRMLIDMIEGGLFEMLEADIRKSEVAKYLKKSDAVPVSGVKMVKRINPQIK